MTSRADIAAAVACPAAPAGRRVGATSVGLPELGFGGAAIGNLYGALSDQAARDTVAAALEGGIGYFDTAPHYGFGLSERRLGDALAAGAGAGSDITISTKVGRRLIPVDPATAARERHGFVEAAPFEPVFDYSRDGVLASFEASLERLGRDRVDILLAHDLGALTHGTEHPRRLREFLDGGWPAMRALKADGRVGAIGVGVNEIEVCLQLLDEVEIDCILLAGRYTLLEQEALTALLPECEARGVSLIVGGPFNSGVLAGACGRESLAAPHRYNYAPAPPEVMARVARIARVCSAHATPLAAAALQFPLAHRCVASVIPGLGSPDEVADALRLKAFEIPAALWEELKAEGLLPPEAPVPCSGACS